MTALEGKALLDHGATIARRYAARLGRETAEELRAEAVARALGTPPPDGRIEPWLERIYRNLVVDLWRRQQPTVELDDVVLAAHGTPEDHVLESERRRAVRAGLAALPLQSRRPLLYRFYGELDDEVAARRFGISATTVRTRVHRALARLRERLHVLRSWLSPLVGRLGTQAAAVGAAPVMVAALIVVIAAGEPPLPRSMATRVALGAPSLATVTASTADAEVASPTTAPVAPRATRAAKRRPASSLPEPPTPLATTEEAPFVVGQILEPDEMIVYGEPYRPVPPCLVEAPRDFLAQIDRMLEDQL